MHNHCKFTFLVHIELCMGCAMKYVQVTSRSRHFTHRTKICRLTNLMVLKTYFVHNRTQFLV